MHSPVSPLPPSATASAAAAAATGAVEHERSVHAGNAPPGYSGEDDIASPSANSTPGPLNRTGSHHSQGTKPAARAKGRSTHQTALTRRTSVEGALGYPVSSSAMALGEPGLGFPVQPRAENVSNSISNSAVSSRPSSAHGLPAAAAVAAPAVSPMPAPPSTGSARVRGKVPAATSIAHK
jgi:hypothetical protein